ncbi:hypothetical protein AGR1A_pAt20593 [Agrobacterium fabacearum CFBP 5771]|nr:hypothetical protein AGR1A_pAt20593 [Agrobacterium fabacearum CFBP 5771]
MADVGRGYPDDPSGRHGDPDRASRWRQHRCRPRAFPVDQRSADKLHHRALLRCLRHHVPAWRVWGVEVVTGQTTIMSADSLLMQGMFKPEQFAPADFFTSSGSVPALGAGAEEIADSGSHNELHCACEIR